MNKRVVTMPFLEADRGDIQHFPIFSKKGRSSIWHKNDGTRPMIPKGFIRGKMTPYVVFSGPVKWE